MSEKPETLRETIDKLRAIAAKSDWAKMEDPLAELHFIRHGEYPEGHTGERWMENGPTEPQSAKPIDETRRKHLEQALNEMRQHTLGEMGSLIQLQLLDDERTEVQLTKDDLRYALACVAAVEAVEKIAKGDADWRDEERKAGDGFVRGQLLGALNQHLGAKPPLTAALKEQEEKNDAERD